METILAAVRHVSWFVEMLGKVEWILAATLGYTIGIAIAIWVFDLISVKISEWDEIKKGNIGVAFIFMALMIATGYILYNIIHDYTTALKELGEQTVFSNYLEIFGWGLVSAISYAVSIGIALIAFDLISVKISEWDEIKNGNIGVALIFSFIILVVSIIISKHISGIASEITKSVWGNYLKAFVWAIADSIGYAISIGLAIVVFDLISTKIDEWEEIKKGNIGVAIIIITLIVVAGILIYQV